MTAAFAEIPANSMINEASDTLVTFFDLLYAKRYEEAVQLFAGGYGILINWNSDIDPQDFPSLLMRGCEWNGFICDLRVNQVIQAEQISPLEFHILVEFISEDGSIYQRYVPQGTNGTYNSHFTFHVVRDCEGRLWVVDWPFYEQFDSE